MVYSRLSPEMTEIVKDFISKGKGTDVDSACGYISVNIPYYVDSSNVGFLYYMDWKNLDIECFFSVECEPVAGKRIFVKIDRFGQLLCTDCYRMSEYMKDVHPDQYREMQRSLLTNIVTDHSGPRIRYLDFKYNSLIKNMDTTYQDYGLTRSGYRKQKIVQNYENNILNHETGIFKDFIYYPLVYSYLDSGLRDIVSEFIRRSEDTELHVHSDYVCVDCDYTCPDSVYVYYHIPNMESLESLLSVECDPVRDKRVVFMIRGLDRIASSDRSKVALYATREKRRDEKTKSCLREYPGRLNQDSAFKQLRYLRVLLQGSGYNASIVDTLYHNYSQTSFLDMK